MITYPINWRSIGHDIDFSEIANALIKCIGRLGIRSLSLSGGIDSTLLLYFMKEVLGDPIYCYTIALDENHPDYIYAKKAAKFFDVKHYPCFLREFLEPDEAVNVFYKYLFAIDVESIIAGDGIDEFACGYYSHLEDTSEQNYISWIRRLQKEQLIPLHQNSGRVSVCLPFLAPDVLHLLSLIPLYAKTGLNRRKKIIYYMAKGNIPEEIIERRKYGFCDVGIIKGGK